MNIFERNNVICSARLGGARNVVRVPHTLGPSSTQRHYDTLPHAYINYYLRTRARARVCVFVKTLLTDIRMYLYIYRLARV